MRFLAGLSMVGSFGAGLLYGFITSLEAHHIPFQLVEAAGSLYVGVGQPVLCASDPGISQPGPCFLSSGFLVSESFQVRSYPVVLVAGRDRLEVDVYEAHPRAASELGIFGLASDVRIVAGGVLLQGDRVHDLEATSRRIQLAKLAIDQGQLTKLVVAGHATQEVTERFSIGGALSRLKKAHPASHLYCVDGFFGASPELVAAKSGNLLSLRPLAGTALRGGQVALLNSSKDLFEHRLMVEQLCDDLGGFVKELDRPARPVLFDAGRLIHLATPMRGRLLPGVTLADVVLAIAPTAAVSGVPRISAVEMLRELEIFRGKYAGIVGLTDPFGDGEVYLSIRGASVVDGRLDLVAGAGIVADSQVDSEVAEIEAKIDVVTRALSAR
ncbi:chorismate-binding protein [Ferrimicrobium acidiphilum]|uniref:chorismate-binding protein n=1 Tax=Ferrimicrobium acidiphilum TaxID=121039 RepID=UPI0023F1BE1A|nr:chorismate-binding protein [Ferrimicrobium acidiphilum]